MRHVYGTNGPAAALAAELRQLKDKSGLSFTQLQARIPFSRSALQRHLSGDHPIPRDAVVAISETCGGDTAALLALWETLDNRSAGRAPSAPARPLPRVVVMPAARTARQVAPSARRRAAPMLIPAQAANPSAG